MLCKNKNYKASLEKNIRVDYLYRFLTSLDLSSAIWVLYLSYKGMSLVQIGIIEAIFHVTSLLCEVPTGAIADLLGRKKTIIIGRLMSAISSIFMLFSTSFLGFTVGFIISAVSYNLNSGSEEALVYDSLKLTGKEDQYIKINGTLNFIIEVAQGIAVFIGGVLSDKSFALCYIIASTISVCVFGISFMFQEPTIREGKENSINFIQHFKDCFNVIRNNRTLVSFMIYFEIIFMVGTSSYFYSQQFFSLMGFSRTNIATLFVISSIFCALGSKVSYGLHKLFKKQIIYIIPVIMGIGLMLLSIKIKVLAIIGFMIIQGFNAMLYPISSGYINKLIPSPQRATLISIQSMCFSIFMIIIFPIIGFIGEGLSLNLCFIALGLILIIFAAINMYIAKNKQS